MNESIERVRRSAQNSLPNFNRLRQQAVDLASQITVGRSAFLNEYGFQSELEYKQQAMRDNRVMYHAHIGMNDVEATTRALARIHEELSLKGYRLDRAGFAIDRRMGLPAEMRAAAAAETGPMLVRDEDWRNFAQAAPIQPHLGDFMIGQPASVDNAIRALRIGCTTIGNLSQYFTFEAPGWDDTAETAAQTYTAMTLLGQFREQGAMLERYLVEELIGARLTHCIGGLTRDPVKRAGWVLALHKIHRGEQVGSMIYGDTLSFGQEFEKNRAVTAEYLLWDILLQLHAPSGHAVLPLPVTEAIRIPSADEIIEAQLFGRQVEASARRLYPHVDFSAAESFAETVCREGAEIYQNALSGLADMGVDITNPLQMLYVLKQLGAQDFEQLFAADQSGSPEFVTDMYAMAQGVIDEYRPLFAEARFRDRVRGKRFLVASSDVHAHAAGALAQLLSETDAEIVYLGAEQNPSDLVAAVMAQPVDALLLSTHNGMALEYASQLKQLLDDASLSLPVIIGGVLNQKIDAQALPVPIIDELKALGMHPASSLPGLPRLLPEKT